MQIHRLRRNGLAISNPRKSALESGALKQTEHNPRWRKNRSAKTVRPNYQTDRFLPHRAKKCDTRARAPLRDGKDEGDRTRRSAEAARRRGRRCGEKMTGTKDAAGTRRSAKARRRVRAKGRILLDAALRLGEGMVHVAQARQRPAGSCRSRRRTGARA